VYIKYNIKYSTLRVNVEVPTISLHSSLNSSHELSEEL